MVLQQSVCGGALIKTIVMDWGLYDSCLCALCIVIVRGPIGLLCVWRRPPHRAGLDMCVAVHLIGESDL